MSQVAHCVKHSNIDLKQLLTKLQNLNQQGFTGKVQIKVNETHNWLFLFRSGSLSWSAAGNSVEERLKRHLKLFFPNLKEINLESMISETDLSKPCMSFFKLLNQGLIQRNKLAELFSSVATEVMFDLIQFTQVNGNKLSCEIIPNDPQTKICLLLPVVEFLPTLKQALQTWQQWQSENLTKYSPNLFPFIQQPALLQSQNLSDINKSIVSQINGSESIRALALKSKLNLVTVTKSLLPLINQGVISLSPVPVTKKSEPRNFTGDAAVKASSVKTPPKRDLLVACVDDSPVVCQAVEKIIESQGYRFLGIQDSLKALPLFLKNKPDFIFLDLVMPITNGYELCAQFRKTPSLKSVPVVILTGRDGLVDRMRAKIAGSNDFLSKPVQEDEVLNVLNKHLQISK